jgi:hypothetical protein
MADVVRMRKDVRMRRRSRTRRFLKWVGLVLCVPILVAWGVSIDRIAALAWYGENSFCTVSTYSGIADFRGGTGESPHGHLERGLHAGLAALPKLNWQARFGLGLPEGRRGPTWCRVGVPLWVLLVLTLIPTAFLWYRDRRWPRGHCQACGYNLTGNESGACPECGEATALRNS